MRYLAIIILLSGCIQMPETAEEYIVRTRKESLERKAKSSLRHKESYQAVSTISFPDSLMPTLLRLQNDSVIGGMIYKHEFSGINSYGARLHATLFYHEDSTGMWVNDWIED